MQSKMQNSIICNEIHQKIGNVNNVLDVGCGEGYLVNCLANKLNKKVVGFDIEDNGFTKSHSRCKQFGTCNLIQCVKGDAHEINNYFKNKFDVIILIYTLHHIKKPKMALQGIRRILKDNGKIIIGEFWFTNRKKKQKCYRFTVKNIKNLLKRAGFKYIGEDRIEDFVFVIGER